MSTELLLGLGAGGLALAIPLLLKLSGKLKAKVRSTVETAIEQPLVEGIALNFIDITLGELEDAIVKVLTEAAKRGRDGKLDKDDMEALKALLKDETVGEVKRQLARLKK